MNAFVGFLMICVLVGMVMWKRPLRQRYIVLGILCVFLCVAYYFLGML
jgi:hypothetical protein